MDDLSLPAIVFMQPQMYVSRRTFLYIYIEIYFHIFLYSGFAFVCGRVLPDEGIHIEFALTAVEIHIAETKGR